jgi:hypothetical protein
MRGVTPKVEFADPVAQTNASLVPYLENVMNGGDAVFSYTCDAAPALQQPPNIREVTIFLKVQAPQRDPQTHQFRTVTVTGQAVRFNPNQ